ncbi:hypothetical protein GCM10027259_35320 [Micromonospora palomenae]
MGLAPAVLRSPCGRTHGFLTVPPIQMPIAPRVVQESDMIFGPAHRSYRDEQHCRSARRRIRETLAVRRAAAAAGQRSVELPDEAKPAA